MAKIKVSREARADLKGIFEYTQQTWGRAQADKYLGMIERACYFLAKHPTSGRACDEFVPGLKCYPAGKHYIFYRNREDTIEVVRVLHQAMDVSRHIKSE
jgi:toxin ParE1/3/4